MRSVAEHEAGRDVGVRASHRLATERALAAMRERPSDSLSLREMTDIAYLSPYHFARVFRRVTNIPPGTFMATLRLERAKQSLLTIGLDVGEIYFEVGHNSVITFTTRFTRLVRWCVARSRARRLPGEVQAAFSRADETWIFARLFPGTIRRN
jgi:transcriptional regulator GlxA family with amidase domain